MALIRFFSGLICLFIATTAFTQEQLSLSGSIESNVNFYQRDTAIGAAHTPQYDHQLIGTETWISLRGQFSGFDLGIRYDIFANSALLNPQDSYTDQGIGRWYIGKKIGKLSLLVGHIYDQFGSGVIFKAYEERPLLIDNALVGLKATYDIAPNWTIKGVAGRQKNLFDLYPSVLKGLNIEGFESLGKEGKVTIAPGLGLMHKTLSDEQMDALAGTLSQYTPEDFIDKAPYNTLAGSIYNTLTAGRFTWYFETAYKTEEVIYDLYATRTLWTGVESRGKFVLAPGYLTFTSLTYAGGGLGLSGQYKRTRNFNFRTDPFVSLNRGIINFLPPMSRINSYRLTARYAPATQDLDEEAVQFDATYAINKRLSILVNVSNINRPKAEENRDIYTEVFTQFTLKKPQKWTLLAGVQFQRYDQELYQGKPDVPDVTAVTPFIDYLVKLTQKKSLRTELQYMSTKQDYGSWIFGLEEFSISPHWIFELSDMWNIKPYVSADGTKKLDDLHFPTAGVVYSAGPTRYALRYVKQVEGIVCSGGICRLEPAFSGFKFNLTSNF
jgi:hypothetical protein